MKKKVYKLAGVKINDGNLVIDGPIKEFGVRGKFEWIKQMTEVQSGFDLSEEKLDEAKVTGRG